MSCEHVATSAMEDSADMHSECSLVSSSGTNDDHHPLSKRTTGIAAPDSVITTSNTYNSNTDTSLSSPTPYSRVSSGSHPDNHTYSEVNDLSMIRGMPNYPSIVCETPDQRIFLATHDYPNESQHIYSTISKTVPPVHVASMTMPNVDEEFARELCTQLTIAVGDHGSSSSPQPYARVSTMPRHHSNASSMGQKNNNQSTLGGTASTGTVPAQNSNTYFKPVRLPSEQTQQTSPVVCDAMGVVTSTYLVQQQQSSDTQLQESSSISSPISSISPPVVVSPTDESTESPEKTSITTTTSFGAGVIMERTDLTRRAERETSKAKLIFSNAQLERISKRATPVQFEDPWPMRSQSVLSSRQPPRKPERVDSLARRRNISPSASYNAPTFSSAYQSKSFDESASDAAPNSSGMSRKSYARSNMGDGAMSACQQDSWNWASSEQRPQSQQKLALRVVSTNYYTNPPERSTQSGSGRTSHVQFEPALSVIPAGSSIMDAASYPYRHSLAEEGPISSSLGSRGYGKNSSVFTPFEEEHEFYSTSNMAATAAAVTSSNSHTSSCLVPHSISAYSLPPSSADEATLTLLNRLPQWLYDKISVELAGNCGKECMSIVATDRGEVGASRLGSEVAAILEHQLNTATSFTPHESKQLRDLLLLNYNFICLLRAHDVIIAELFDNQSNCSSPLGATSTSDTRHNSLPSPQTMPTTLSLSGRHALAPNTSTGTHQHSSSHAANSATATTHHHQHIHGSANANAPNGNCQPTTGVSAAILAGEGGESNSASSPGSSPLLPAVSSGATTAAQGPGPTEVTRVKQVNFHRNKGEPLGITLKILKTDQVVVSRVMIGGMIHRQKILNEGDEILEINGRSIRRHSEDELRDLLNHIAGDIVIKVTPKQHTGSINSSSYASSSGANCHDNNNTLLSQSFFVRAMFDYRPEEDTTSQAAAAFGLAFQARDILQILRHKTSEPDYSVSVQSLNNIQHQEHLGKSGVVASQLTENQRWWQARVVCRASEAANSLAPLAEDLDLDKEASLTLGGVSSSSRKVGLVPSCLWRMETIRNEQLTGDKIRSSCGLFSRKKKRLNVIELSEDEIYERVVQIREPVPRRSLLLVGAPGVGRRSIKNSLIHVDHRFAYPKPHTSKPVDSECVDEHGNSLYHHVAHHELVAAANRGEYLEVGRWNDAWFGTKFHTIDRIMQNNLIPVLDIEPDSIKKLRNSKYMPYVVFVDAPRSFDNSSASASRDDASVAQSFEQLLHVSDDIDRHYRALFDMHIENRQLDKTVELIRGAFDRVCTNANEWLPLNWVGGSSNSSSSNNTSVASSANNNQHYNNNTSAVASSSTHLSSNAATHVPVHTSASNSSTT